VRGSSGASLAVSTTVGVSGSSQARPNSASNPRPNRRSFETAQSSLIECHIARPSWPAVAGVRTNCSFMAPTDPRWVGYSLSRATASILAHEHAGRPSASDSRNLCGRPPKCHRLTGHSGPTLSSAEDTVCLISVVFLESNQRSAPRLPIASNSHEE
jgi:hypothetical protein